MQAYIVTVECRRQQSDTSCDSSAESNPSLVDTVTAAIQCLSTRSISKYQGIRGLKAFVRVDCFHAAELCQG